MAYGRFYGLWEVLWPMGGSMGVCPPLSVGLLGRVQAYEGLCLNRGSRKGPGQYNCGVLGCLAVWKVYLYL